jgi:MYXO-CTERM domain-containing protein
MRRIATLSALALASAACGAPDREHARTASALEAGQSELWGVDGELFDAAGRVMDWSYAGYHAGEDPLPSPSSTITVTTFGATADDASDDTQAFIDALASAQPGDVVSIPAGRFVISDKLTLESGVVLRGAGPNATVLEIPVSLTDNYGNPGLDGGGQSSYSFGGAFIESKGSDGGDVLANVTAPAARGTRTLEIDDTSAIAAGDWVQIEQTDVGGELMRRLHADLMDGGSDNVGDKGMDFHTRVAQVGSGSIELERALPLDVDTGWSPVVKSVDPSTGEVGVEHLAIEFPETTYPGHFDELGYNAIHFNNVQDSWVDDVRIVNTDYGVNITNCHFVTVQGVVIQTTNQRNGHHALNNGHGGDNLFIGFDLQVAFVHDITNEWYATGIVVTQGRGDDLAMDHHRAAPYTTLWTEIDAGAGTRPFQSGGSTNRGPHTAAYDTLWNVSADADMDLPADDFGPRMNFVGFRTAATSVSSPYDWWLEAMAPAAVDPPNLWLAMRDKRLGPSGTGGTGGAAGSGAGGSGATAGSGNASGSAGSGNAGSGGSPADDGSGNVDGGCGCRTPARSSDGSALLFVIALGALARRRSNRS